MIIAFEGMDGCGKSTVASEFAKENSFIHEEQRITTILDISKEKFDKLVKIVRRSNNKKLSLVFYTFRCMLDNEMDINAVIERTMLSTYYFEKNNVENNYWDYVMELGVIPNITFVLYASPEERYKRIKQRNPNDEDLKSKEALFDGYNDMIEYAKKYSIPYVGINTEKYNVKQIVAICTEIMKVYSNIPEAEEKMNFLKEMNNIYGFENKEKNKVKTKEL